MNLDNDLSDIAKSLGDLQDELAQATPTVADPELRQFMESMSEKLQSGRAQFAEVYKSASAGVDAKLAKAQEKAQALSEQASAAQKQLAEAPIPKLPALPARPAFAVDRNLGQKLRQELLDRFAPDQPEAEQQAWEAGREAWDDWADWSQR
jgi:hypothetical protein